MTASVFMASASVSIVSEKVRIWRVFGTNTRELRGDAPLKRPKSAFMGPRGPLDRRSGGVAGLPESPRLGQGRDTAVVVSERLSKHFPGVLAEQRRRHGIDRRRQAHMERRFNVGNSARRRMRDPAETVAVAHFRSVEAFLDRAQIANRYVGFLHLGHPVLEPVAGEDACNNGAQLFLVCGSVFPVGELGIGDEVRTFEYLGHQPA